VWKVTADACSTVVVDDDGKKKNPVMCHGHGVSKSRKQLNGNVPRGKENGISICVRARA
jgi:DnaJ-class molecular chaperone